MKQYTQALGVLAAAIDSVNKILTAPTDQNHRLKIVHSLQREIDHLNLITGAGVVEQKEAPAKLGPAKTIAGEKIVPMNKVTTPADLAPDQNKLNVLRSKVEEAYGSFLTMESKDILANVDPMVIRGVAKKAGMKVTSEEPATLTLEFIDQVKDEVKAANGKIENKQQIQVDIATAQEKLEVLGREHTTQEAKIADLQTSLLNAPNKKASDAITRQIETELEHLKYVRATMEETSAVLEQLQKQTV